MSFNIYSGDVYKYKGYRFKKVKGSNTDCLLVAVEGKQGEAYFTNCKLSKEPGELDKDLDEIWAEEVLKFAFDNEWKI